MKCPSCEAFLSAPAPECPGCKLTLRRLDAKFGTSPRRTRYLTDRTGRLPLREIKKLRQSLRIFERKFPQSLFSVFITDQLATGHIGEYTFWLANRARFSSIEAVGADNFDLILGIDLPGRAAALTVGYGLEQYLREEDLRAALLAGSDAFAAGDIAAGIQACTDWMTNRMREIVREIEQRSPSAPDEPSTTDY